MNTNDIPGELSLENMIFSHDRCITSGGVPASFKNLFSPSGRLESAGLILAHCCGSIANYCNGSADLVVSKLETQLNCKVSLRRL